jgi:hypothetical protein
MGVIYVRPQEAIEVPEGGAASGTQAPTAMPGWSGRAALLWWRCRVRGGPRDNPRKRRD